jgi:disease resistance protein
MSIKLYIHLEEAGYPSQTSKIAVPKSWTTKEVKDVIGLFVGAYNKKNPDNLLEMGNLHFALQDGTKIFSNETVETALEDHQDYYIKFGQHVKEIEKKVELDPSLLKCRNYGCNQYFREEENVEGVCQHHTGPPIFHDTMKCWSCCKDRKAYDFESFQAITGCATGRHSAIAPTIALGASPTASLREGINTTSDESSTPQPVLKSISDYNQANPTAISAATAATKTLARKSTRQTDGTAKCQRKGCQKQFHIDENHAEACNYHQGQPIFHDVCTALRYQRLPIDTYRYPLMP